MEKNRDIHIKLEISRDPNTGNLTIMTIFDPNAPNFIKQEDGFSWSPTTAERVFINEAFELIQKEKN